MKKTLLYLLMVAILVMAPVMAACNGESETPTTTSQPPTTTSQPPTTTSQPPTTTSQPPTTTSQPPTTTSQPPTTTSQPPTTTSQPPTTTTSSGEAPVPSAANHPGQTDDSLCAMCHPAPYAYPDDHEGRTSGCLAAGCHQLEGAATTQPPTTTAGDNGGEAVRDEMPDTYRYVISFSSSYGMTGEYKVWVKGDKIRLEMTMEEGGEEMTTIVIFDGTSQYVYMPDQNMAIKYPVDSESSPAAGFDAFAGYFTEYYTTYETDADILLAWEAACAADPYCQSVAIVDHESVGGVACTVFEVTYTDGTQARVWVSGDMGYVLKVESEVEGETTTIEFTEVELGSNIADSMFELPDGVEIMDMSGM